MENVITICYMDKQDIKHADQSTNYNISQNSVAKNSTELHSLELHFARFIQKVMKIPKLKHVSFVFMFTFLTACGGGGGSEDTPGTSAPTVSSTSPVNSATAVARDSSLTANFDKDIFAVTVDDVSFTLTQPGGVNTPGSVTFDGANNVASFTPGSLLAVHAPYTATLSTAITDLSGNALAASYNWSFTTADGEWGNAELIGGDISGNTSSPQIAVDNNGHAITVWLQFDGIRINIWSNRFDGSNWGSAELIESDNAGDALAPQVAVDNNGHAIAVWRQTDGATYNIWSNRFDGSNWGSAELIESDNTGDAFAPQVVFDNHGHAFAVWRQTDGTTYNIWSNRFDGSHWGSAELIESDNAGNANIPQIAVDNNGHAIAVWEQTDGTTYNIWSNRFDGSHWGSAELIESYNAGDANTPQIAVDNNGHAIAVWRQTDGSTYNIWSNRFDGSHWGSAELIESDNAEHTFDPQIAFDSNGHALAVWVQTDGILQNYWANHFDDNNWGSAAQIEMDNADVAFTGVSPRISLDSNGNALAVWSKDDGLRTNIWASRFDGSNWSNVLRIETDNAGGAFSPQVTVNNNGDAFAIWAQEDSSARINIWANRFE